MTGAQIRARVVPIALAAIAIVAAIVFRRELIGWFTGKRAGGPTSAAVRTTAGSLQIETAIQPDRPREKGNTAHVAVRDAAGAPISGAQVRVEYDMPAMGAMAAMRGGADARDRGDGRYTADFDLPMGGSWTLTVKVDATAAAGTARYQLTIGSPGLTALGGDATASSHAHAAPPMVAPLELPPAVLSPLQDAFAAYDVLRGALASDSKDGAIAPAKAVAAAIRKAQAALTAGPSDVALCLDHGAAAADAIAGAKDLAEARHQFGELSRFLIALASADPRLQVGWRVAACSMWTDGFNRWFQHEGEISNPFMGTRMATCGDESSFEVVASSAPAGDGDEVSYYTCSMHPSVRSKKPGACPICSMDLLAVTKEEESSGNVRIDASRRAFLGIQTGKVTRAPLDLAITAVGRVTFDETRLSDVTSKVGGYITDLKVSATGQAVRKGETLFTLYSPDLFAAQQEYLIAKQSQASAQAMGTSDRVDALVRAAETKLRLWGVGNAQLAAIAARGAPIESLPFPSPASGVVIEKSIVDGASIQAGERLFRIAALDQIWVEADVYEGDLARISKGQAATVSLTYLPGRTFEGKVAFVYPYLDPATRTGRVRVALPNKGMELKPDMYATVAFRVPLGERLQVPVSAVVYTGPRRIVFVDLGDGRLHPQEVTIGARNGDSVEIIAGLKEGDVVVTTGNFLVAAESRVRSASTFWEDTDVGR